MITCKEDLYGTEFVIESKDDAILLEAKCAELGIEKATWSGCDYISGLMRGLIGKDLGSPHSKKLIFTSQIESDETMEEFSMLKRLALSDLKPKRTKVEYMKAEFNSMWEAVKAFEGGEVFHTHFMSAGWTEVENVQQVIPNIQVDKLYRRIETEMTERDIFIEECEKFSNHGKKLNIDEKRIVESMFDSGEFKFVGGKND